MFRNTFTFLAKYWVALIVFLLLSFGTHLTVMANDLPIPLPYSVLQNVPFISISRAPSRWIVLVYLFLAIIISFALKYLFTTRFDNKVNRYAFVFICALVFFDYYSRSNEKTLIHLPECYLTIENNSNNFGILNYPPGDNILKEYMMYQTQHGIPIVQGQISRKVGQSLQENLKLDDISNLHQQLIDNNVKYIVAHKNLLDKEVSYTISKFKSRFKNIVCEDNHQIVFEMY